MKKIVVALCLLLWLAPVPADGQKPLLIPGKTSLYQRVLSIPEARLADQPGDSQGVEVTPFSAFYVYERRQLDGREWLLLGTDRHGSLSGWMPARDSIAWNQGLTVEFRDPAGHDRVLMFKNKAALKSLAKAGADENYDRLYRQAVQGELPADSPVIAIQPAGHIDIRKDFYLVPILDFQDTWLGSEQARMLKIASVPLESPDKPSAAAQNDDYTAGLVFVIDASLSMDEYIERTREAVMKIYDQLGDAGQLGKVDFGLVAFRDNAGSVPGLDYTARTWVTLEEGRNPGAFLEKVDQLSAAKVSSRDFREDAYAGLQQAIEGMNWQGHDARYIVLITDAGAREGDDPLSTTGLSTDEVRQLAQNNGIAIFVLHLKTPAKMADHQAAEAQYQELSDFPGIGSLYYGVPTGDVAEFGTVLDSLAGQISAQVAQGVNKPESDSPVVKNNPRLAELQGKVEKLGYALRMQYLQQHKGGRLPRVFDAWMLDHDIREPARPVVNVRVLLTRDQLSDLHDVLQQVLRTAEDGLLSPQTFLDELKSLAATISRNPEELGRTTATTAGEGNSLVDMGFIGEYIEGLPYTGEVMSLSLDDWQSWPVRRQVDFLRRLEDKIAYYRALHDNTDLWISLDKGPVNGDSVFPLPLEMLP